MSVVIVVKVSEGLVLAADSAATLLGKLAGPGMVQDGVLKTFYNAKKVLQIGDFPIGVLTWGHSFIGPRTLDSLIREWEHDAFWESMHSFSTKYQEPYRVVDCAEGLCRHLTRIHQQEFGDLPTNEQPATGIIVAGYSAGEFFPEIWRFVVPLDSSPINQRPDKDGKPDFGASWFGMIEPIVRLHFGRDEQVIRLISERFDIPVEEIAQVLRSLEYPVPFAQMPLQDAIEYANYMINIAVGRYRFVLGPEFCGGDIDTAIITQREFSWVSRKSWRTE